MGLSSNPNVSHVPSNTIDMKSPSYRFIVLEPVKFSKPLMMISPFDVVICSAVIAIAESSFVRVSMKKSESGDGVSFQRGLYQTVAYCP